VVVEEHSYRGGVGSAILETLSNHAISAQVALVAASQTNLSQIGDQEFLRNENGISSKNMISKFLALLAN
jgi:transketolase C-terminal domain/subunit